MTDLYDELGVPRDADTDTLKRARNAAARQHHPDHGGDREQFERVQRAYLVLSDPERRARYDATGETDDTPSNDLAERTAILVGAFDRAMQRGSFDRADIIARMGTFLVEDAGKLRAKAAEAEEQLELVVDARKRLQFSGSGVDVIGQTLIERENAARATAAKRRRMAETVEKIAATLDEYRWEFDASPPPTYTIDIGELLRSGTATMGGGFRPSWP